MIWMSLSISLLHLGDYSACFFWNSKNNNVNTIRSKHVTTLSFVLLS